LKTTRNPIKGTAEKSAQAKRPTAKPAKSRQASTAKTQKPAVASALPCHRLAPRTAAQTRELQNFTANLGAHLASCIFAGGDVEHLFQRSGGQFLIVTEAVNVAGTGVRGRGLAETLWERRVTLADYVKRRPGVTFGRFFAFEVLPPEEIAVWAEEAEVAASLPTAVRRLLWGEDEVAGKTKGRMILSTVRTSDRQDRICIYARAGEYFEENEETGETKSIDRSSVESRLRIYVVLPWIDQRLPLSFRRDFQVFRRDDEDSPAEPADVLLS